MGQVLLKTENLVKQFEGLVAVNQVTFDIQEGEILTIIGPNGAGKSVLFGLISGLLRPTSGHIYLQGKEISGLKTPSDRRKRYFPHFPDHGPF